MLSSIQSLDVGAIGVDADTLYGNVRSLNDLI